MLKVKSVLVSQPKPETEKSPYFSLEEMCKVKIDFRPFIHVEGIPRQEFRLQKINLLDFDAVIFTSRNAVDHYFRAAEEARNKIPDEMKYFCISESIAYYLQKYVQYRKRKIFYGKQKFPDLVEVILKHSEEKFLLPNSDIHKRSMLDLLDNAKINYTNAIIYRTVAADLSHIDLKKFDLIVFFSPAGIKSLQSNFPDFNQNSQLFAAFGSTTATAVNEGGYRLDIPAPTQSAPSMTMAIEEYLTEKEKERRRNSRK